MRHLLGTLLAGEIHNNMLHVGPPARFVSGLRGFRGRTHTNSGHTHCNPGSDVHRWPDLGASETEQKTSDQDMGNRADTLHFRGLRPGVTMGVTASSAAMRMAPVSHSPMGPSRSPASRGHSVVAIGAWDAAAKTIGQPWRKRARTGFWATDWKSETGRESSAW